MSGALQALVCGAPICNHSRVCKPVQSCRCLMQTESCAVEALQPFRPWPGCSLGLGPALLQASTLFYSVKLIACALHSYGLRALSSILTCPGLLSLPAGHLHGPKSALIHTLSRVRHLRPGHSWHCVQGRGVQAEHCLSFSHLRSYKSVPATGIGAPGAFSSALSSHMCPLEPEVDLKIQVKSCSPFPWCLCNHSVPAVHLCVHGADRHDTPGSRSAPGCSK